MNSIKYWEPPADAEYYPQPEDLNVDLKWSVWSMDETEWEERAPGAWEQMREYFDASTDPGNPEQSELVGHPLVVNSGPRKEIRWGTVEISPGRATVKMWAEWDNGTQFLLEEQIEAETFEELMHLIDHCEIELIRVNQDIKKLRCSCGYPFRNTKSNRFVENRYTVSKIRPH